MNKKLEIYLKNVNKYLKPLPLSERVDIVKEIKSSIIEMQNQNFSTEEILQKLDNPKDLAKSYLSDLLSNKTTLTTTKFLIILAFYSLVGFSGLFIMPFLGILAPCLILIGIFTAFLGTVNLIDAYLFNIPFADNIHINLYNIPLSPGIGFFTTFIVGTILFILGFLCWKLLILYCKKVATVQRKLLS